MIYLVLADKGHRRQPDYITRVRNQLALRFDDYLKTLTSQPLLEAYNNLEKIQPDTPAQEISIVEHLERLLFVTDKVSIDYEAVLRAEGFLHVYSWEDPAGTAYEAHAHKGPVSMYITKGSLMFSLPGTNTLMLRKGDRLDVPVGVEHTAVVGPQGCSFVVGEMIEGDS